MRCYYCLNDQLADGWWAIGICRAPYLVFQILRRDGEALDTRQQARDNRIRLYPAVVGVVRQFELQTV